MLSSVAQQYAFFPQTSLSENRMALLSSSVVLHYRVSVVDPVRPLLAMVMHRGSRQALQSFILQVWMSSILFKNST